MHFLSQALSQVEVLQVEVLQVEVLGEHLEAEPIEAIGQFALDEGVDPISESLEHRLALLGGDSTLFDGLVDQPFGLVEHGVAVDDLVEGPVLDGIADFVRREAFEGVPQDVPNRSWTRSESLAELVEAVRIIREAEGPAEEVSCFVRDLFFDVFCLLGADDALVDEAIEQ